VTTPPDHRSVVTLFDQIAPVYDSLNHVISWGRDRRWRQDLARRLSLTPGQRILDISAGTGDMEPALKKSCAEIDVIGLDPSRRMMELYRVKVTRAKTTQGIAEFLPLKDKSVHHAVSSFGLRNFRDRRTAYREIQRVLKSGGHWGFLEMSTPTGMIFPHIYGLYFKSIVPLIGKVFSPGQGAYEYLRDSVYAFPGLDALEAEHISAGFRLVYSRLILQGAVILAIFKKQ
jgi:demethylmenaquinone methyltransferase/2-methoxy-6-polyprenyl-1,4-benzoquinol methylase